MGIFNPSANFTFSMRWAKIAYLVVGQVLPMNPVASVRGPKYVIKKGKTSAFSRPRKRAI